MVEGDDDAADAQRHALQVGVLPGADIDRLAALRHGQRGVVSDDVPGHRQLGTSLDDGTAVVGGLEGEQVGKPLVDDPPGG